MTNMLKKSLVAIALAGVSTGAMAATIQDVTSLNVSNEWLKTAPAGTANNPTAVIGVAFEFTLGAAYAQNDLIHFTFTGDSVMQNTTPPITVTGPNGEATLGFISNEVNSSGNRVITYRVSTVDGNTNEASGRVEDLQFRASAIGGNIDVTFSAETSTGQALDTAGKANERTKRLITLGNQFDSLSFKAPGAVGASGLNAVINVSTSRTQLVGSQERSESFRFYPSSESTTAYVPFVPSSDYGVSYGQVEYILTGDFGWMLHPTSGALLPGRFDVPTSCQGDPVVTADSIVVTCPWDVEFEFDAAGNETATIPTQTLGLEANIPYFAPSSSTPVFATLSTTAGQWTLNGSDVQVSYMPYSSNITQVINVTNRSNQSGDISAEAITEDGTTWDLGVVGYSEAGSITRVAGDILTALSEKVGTDLSAAGQTQRFALRIVTNAPEHDVEVYSAYNVGQSGARLVVNDSNGGAVSK